MDELIPPPMASLEAALKSRLSYLLRNNEARIRDLRTLATPGFKRTFDLAPALLHHNHPDLPGYLSDPQTPHGLVFYDVWLKNNPFPDPRPFSDPYLDRKPDFLAVECLVLIGSSGSVGHTSRSDLDYWVCYNPDRFTENGLRLFREKLAAITRWAMEENHTEANFYPIDLAVLGQGRLNSLSEERDGEVAPMLLIEELFRTILHVAGRHPLWCVWPPEKTPEEYKETAKILAPLAWEKEPPFFVDLGFPAKPRPQEYLASAMWLTCKSEHDPFKGLLKIMPIMEAVETEFQSPLLCEIVRDKVFSAKNEELPVDPYTVTVDRVIDFVSRRLSPKLLDLAREAAVLKVLGRSSDHLDARNQGPTNPKTRALNRWREEWAWPPGKLERLRDYDNWTNAEKSAEAQELIKLLFSCYMIIANHLMTNFPGQVDAQNEVLAPMAARMLGRLGGAEVTVELLPSHILRENLSKRFLFRRETSGWTVYAWPEELEDEGDIVPSDAIYQTARAAKAAAWLVSNQLYGPETKVRLSALDTDFLSLERLNEYLEKLAELFPPIKFHTLNPQTIWQAQAQGPVLLTFNFEEPVEGRIIRSLDVIYRTGWGETRHQHKDVSSLTVEADKLFLLSELLHESCGISSSEPLVFLPGPQPLMSRVFTNLMGAINVRFRSKSQSQGQSFTKSLIDL